MQYVRISLAFNLSVLLASSSSAQTTWYVDAAATPPGNGSPATPFTNIQRAVASATTVSGDTLLVLPGTYAEGIDFLGKGLRVVARDGAAVTTIDASARYDSVVVFRSGEGPLAELRGFTLTGGTGHDNGTWWVGGGLFIEQSSPTIRDCVIVSNEANLGGGAYGLVSSARFENCRFEANTSFVGGDGIYFDMSSPTFVDCALRLHFSQAQNGGHAGQLQNSAATFEGCTIASNGDFIGGFRIEAGSVVAFSDCDFVGNGSIGSGAALHIANSVVILQACDFVANAVYSGYDGGAIQCDSGQITATRCSFVGNFATRGGAVYSAGSGLFEECEFRSNWVQCDDLAGAGDFGALWAGPNTTVRRSVFVGNRALGSCTNGNDGDGGAVGGGVVLEHCTLVGNSASRFGAVESASLRNCIVWGNSPEPMGGSTSATYCGLEFPIPGSGNFSSDPLLWGGVAPDLHLRAGSPCIDSGDPLGATDPDGSRADVGAFPFDSNYLPPIARYCTPKISSLGCVPRAGSAGSATLSGPDDLLLTAIEVLNQKSGLLFWGLTPRNAPFHGGTLCVGMPQNRTSIQSSGGSSGGADCSGVFSLHVSHAQLNSWGLGAGARFYAQYWYRDPGFAAPGNVGLSDAVEVTVGP